LISKSRVVLAKADADLTGDGFQVAVIKVKTADTLALEIFETRAETGRIQFVKRIILPQKRDAYFNFHGHTSNLVMADVDNDKQLEIIAPTFDDDLIPHLNVYKYDVESKDFRRVGPENLEL